MGWIEMMFNPVRALFRSQAELAAENLALRQQLAVLSEQKKRPWLRKRDRIFWAWLARLWSNWPSILVIVQPETVARWHRTRLQVLLALEVASRQGRSARDRCRHPRSDPTHFA